MWEDQPVLCGVLMRQAPILERVASPQPSQCWSPPEHTSAQMETMGELQAGALVHGVYEGEESGGRQIQEAGSRSRSPTPESSYTPSAAEQETISTEDVARILRSLHSSQPSRRVLSVATPLFSSPVACTLVFFSN